MTWEREGGIRAYDMHLLWSHPVGFDISPRLYLGIHLSKNPWVGQENAGLGGCDIRSIRKIERFICNLACPR